MNGKLKTKTALIVIDVQEKLFKKMPEQGTLLKNMRHLDAHVKVDEAESCYDDRVSIVSRVRIFLPVNYQNWDIWAPPTYIPIPYAGTREPVALDYW